MSKTDVMSGFTDYVPEDYHSISREERVSGVISLDIGILIFNSVEAQILKWISHAKVNDSKGNYDYKAKKAIPSGVIIVELDKARKDIVGCLMEYINSL